MNIRAGLFAFIVASVHLTFGSPAVGNSISAEARRWAEDVHAEAGVSGGFVVHIGNVGERTAALRTCERHCVQGLSSDSDDVRAARDAIQSLGCYGPVTVAPFDGPAKLTPAWSRKLGGKLSRLTAANGKIYVAAIDRHTLHTLDAATGKPGWSFTAGGRIESPPTIDGGRVYFGSHDGFAYCPREEDGALAWKFHAAPREAMLVADDQPESVWPVHGSVLV